MFYRILLTATLVALIGSSFGIQMGYKRTQQIFEMCYGTQNEYRVRGHVNSMSHSIENFIALIEKVEKSVKRGNIVRDPFEFAKTLLFSFRLDAARYTSSGLLQNNKAYSIMDAFENKLIGYSRTADEEAEDATVFDVLSVDEQCALHFMLSFYMNDTISNGYTLGRGSNRGSQSTRKWREQGVVNFLNSAQNAITTRYLLLGIIGAEAKSQRAYDLINSESMRDESHMNEEDNLDPLLCLTISNAFVLSAMVARTDKNEIGNMGEWVSTVCPINYLLTSKSGNMPLPTATQASFRGAYDGYNIGRLVRESNAMRTYPLSKILGLYYDAVGETAIGMGICKRELMKNGIEPQLLTQNNQNIALYAERIDGFRYRERLNSLNSQLVSVLNSAKKLSPEEDKWCRDNSIENNPSPVCETPADVFFVVDASDLDYINEQLSIIEHVSRYLDLGPNKGTVTLLTLKKNSTDNSLLNAPVWASSDRVSAGCALNSIKNNLNNDITLASTEFYHRLTDVLSLFTKSTAQETVGRAKPVIIFGRGFENQRADIKVIAARRLLKIRFPEATLIAVTRKSGEEIKDYIHNTRNVVKFVASSAESVAQDIANALCKSPAIIQHPRCDTEKSRDGSPQHDIYVTRGRRQFWSIFPKHFFGTQNLVMKFRSPDPIRVCFSRQYDPDQVGECKNSDRGHDIEFVENDVCYNKNNLNCEPMNFMIEAQGESATPGNICNDPRCKNINQAKITLNTIGMICDGSSALKTSPIIILSSALMLLMKNLSGH